MSLSPATVAAVLSIDYLALGRHVDEATAAGWALSLEDLADGPTWSRWRAVLPAKVSSLRPSCGRQ